MSEYKICKRCVMDNLNTDITFDENGYCNYCTEALKNKDKIWKNNEIGKKELDSLIEKIKQDGKGKKYDCIIGISGGIDSSYCAYLCNKYNLRMLGIHIDAGWNTDISEKNIKNLCKKLNLDLKVIKMNEKEMMDLQKAYFKAEVINQDVPQDSAFFSNLYRYAINNNLKYVINGSNFSSESILPKSWGFDANDGRNTLDIHKKYGSIKLKEYKPFTFYEKYIEQKYINKLKIVKPLNLIDYNKENAIIELHDMLNFEYYGSKHCESAFTRLYQGYILPEKFGVNKSKAHYSSLIVANQITREEALKKISNNEYKNSDQCEKDIELFIKKIGISRKYFDNIISDGIVRRHKDFKNYNNIYNFFRKIKSLLRKT
ncbi:MAG: N-acetyl sugar amidotransferase [Clostridia bacterium]